MSTTSLYNVSTLDNFILHLSVQVYSINSGNELKITKSICQYSVTRSHDLYGYWSYYQFNNISHIAGVKYQSLYEYIPY